MEASNQRNGDKKIYFAAGVYKEEGWANLEWVPKNFPGHKIFLLHVLLPRPRLAIFSKSSKDIKKASAQDNMETYKAMLGSIGLEAEEVSIKKDKVGEGIVALISQHGIQNLVMGAPACDMIYMESTATKHVSNNAPPCQVWFLHKGYLIRTRYKQNITGGHSLIKTYQDLMLEKAEKERAEAGSKVQKAEHLLGEEMQPVKERDIKGVTTVVAMPIRTAPDLVPSPAPASTRSVVGGNVDDKLRERLREAIAESTTAKREAVNSSLKRKKAEKDLSEAVQQAKVTENKYNEETDLRRESEVAFLRQKQKLGNMSSHIVALMEELSNTLKKNSLLEVEIAESKTNIGELREKIVSSVKMLLSYKIEQDELKATRDHAMEAAESLRQQSESAKSNSSFPLFLSEFSYSEIARATCHFHSSLKIDERGIYKGILHHMEVAIKTLHGDSLRGPSEYRLEVEALSRLRHPNIVTMIGVCPEALAIVYEYFLNGSLEDRLNCKDNSSPLTWRARVRIAFEICSVLIFLHSSKPQSYVHGALHPSNILLDANFTTKLSQFGNCRAVTTAENSPIKSYVNKLGNVLTKMIIQKTADEESGQSHSVTPCPYMDPESVLTGEINTLVDVYAFGKIILKLLTGKESWGITSKIERALDDGTFNKLLDSSAGNWPNQQAQQLARIAVRCTDMNKENRPDLKTEVLEVLRTMKESSKSSSKASPFVHDKDSQPKPPHYCICPISQDLMQNPSLAADGYTYEAEAIQEWINSGHNTSPMTNLTLAHTNLLPNLPLRSAIQDWLHHH